MLARENREDGQPSSNLENTALEVTLSEAVTSPEEVNARTRERSPLGILTSAEHSRHTSTADIAAMIVANDNTSRRMRDILFVTFGPPTMTLQTANSGFPSSGPSTGQMTSLLTAKKHFNWTDICSNEWSRTDRLARGGHHI